MEIVGPDGRRYDVKPDGTVAILGEAPPGTTGPTGPAPRALKEGGPKGKKPIPPDRIPSLPVASLTVPSNLFELFQDLEAEYGIPMYVIAGAVSRSMGFGRQYNEAKARALVEQMATAYQDSGDWSQAAGRVGGPGLADYISRLYLTDPKTGEATSFTNIIPGVPRAAPGVKREDLPVNIDEIGDLFEQYLGRRPVDDREAEGYGREGLPYRQVRDELIASAEGRQWRQYGTQITAVRGSWANGLWQRYLGKPPTNAEVLVLVKEGMTPAQTEAYLRRQPYGTTESTLGDVAQLREQMNKAARDIFDRDADEGEISFAIQNLATLRAQGRKWDANAYYQQVRDKAVWGERPDLYREYQRQIREGLGRFGVTVQNEDIEPSLLQAAVTGRWTAGQLEQSLRSRQMPGAPAGTTIDRYTTTKNLAEGIWRTYFPTATMPQPYMNDFLRMTPDQTAAFVRSLPSPDASAELGTVIPVGAYNDAKAAAKSILDRLGAIGREPTTREVAQFAAGGNDAEAIARFYSEDPEVNRINPGARYGLSRERYYSERQQAERGYEQRFGATGTRAAVEAKAAAPTPGEAPAEAPWVSAVFKEKLTPAETQAAFDDYFRRMGKPPSAEDISMFRTRARDRFQDDAEIRRQTIAASAVQQTPLGPTMPALAGPKTRRRAGVPA